MIRMFNMDCMTAMASMPDKAYELAIVDPPYGIGEALQRGGGKLKNTPAAVKRYEKHKLQPDMFQVKKEEIIQEELI